MKLAVGNLKGGSGKSTTAVHLALGLARTGRVLVADADGTNRTVLKWSTLAEDWPANVTVVGWEVPDLAKRIRGIEADYDHVVIDTGPQRPDILKQALLATGNLLVTVGPSPVELEQLPDTFALAAEVDALRETFAQVLLVRVRARTRSGAEARGYLNSKGLPVMAAEVGLREVYPLSFGAVPADLGDYDAVLDELAADAAEVAG